MDKHDTTCTEPETFCIGAMHRVRASTGLLGYTDCVKCGARPDEFSKPCSAFMNEAAAVRAAIERAR